MKNIIINHPDGVKTLEELNELSEVYKIENKGERFLITSIQTLINKIVELDAELTSNKSIISALDNHISIKPKINK